MFIDKTLIKLQAGNGGNGCLGFRREKFITKGGPDGGNGGNGGDVILQGDYNINDLKSYHFINNLKAESGSSGMVSKKSGRCGNNHIIRFPIGTVIYNHLNNHKVAEIVKHDKQIVLLRGGNGGFGNLHFKSSTNRAPRRTTLGLKGEEMLLRLEFKIIADIGLIGLPNSGKSTLMNIMTGACHKTGHYPLTTIHPGLGTMEQRHKYSIKIVDMPGIVSKDSGGSLFGYSFFQHIENCKALIVILEARRPLKEDWEKLLSEISRFKHSLLSKPRFIIFNKIDLTVKCKNDYFNINSINCFRNEIIIPISCRTGQGISLLKGIIQKVLF